LLPKLITLNITILLAFVAFKNAQYIYEHGNTRQAVFIVIFATLCIMMIVFNIYWPVWL